MNLAEFHFIRPYWLLALIPTLLVFILLVKQKLNHGSWSEVCDAKLLPYILHDKPRQQSSWFLYVNLLASLLVIIALAGPTWERLPVPVFKNITALVIALDLSFSMNATDIKPSRLKLARYKIADILSQRKDGQTALLVYAGDAFTVTPLTEDNAIISRQLSVLTTQIMPSKGSNSTIAIKSSIALLEQSGIQQGDILLVTDGIDYASTIDVIDSLALHSLSILGVGTTEGAPIKTADGRLATDAQGNIVLSKLNPDELLKLANKGNGIYKSISSNDSDIEALLDHFDNVVAKKENSDFKLLLEQWHEVGYWLLFLVLPFMALHFRKGWLSLALLLILLPIPKTSWALEWNDLWQTQNQRAEQSFKQKNYSQAAKQFTHTQWKAAAQYKAEEYQKVIETLSKDKSARGLYNLANALAKVGRLQESIVAYDKSLAIKPNNEDAKYNKTQVVKALEKQQKQQQKQKQQQQTAQNQGSKNEKSKSNDSKLDNSNAGLEKSTKQQDNASIPETQNPKPEIIDQAKQDKSKTSTEQQEKEGLQAEKATENNEFTQADEQWLKQVTDDPTGLLRRKFKYQYSKRNKTTNYN